jgi:hypothetical protein
VRWPSACKDETPGAEELPPLSQLRVAFMGSEKMVAKPEENSGIKRKANVRRWETATKQRLED